MGLNKSSGGFILSRAYEGYINYCAYSTYLLLLIEFSQSGLQLLSARTTAVCSPVLPENRGPVSSLNVGSSQRSIPLQIRGPISSIIITRYTLRLHLARVHQPHPPAQRGQSHDSSTKVQGHPGTSSSQEMLTETRSPIPKITLIHNNVPNET